MFKNYFLVTVRSLVNQKFYSIINTVGLALGIAACIIILLYVQDELSYEKAYKNHDRIYRLVQDFPMGDHLSQSATVPFPTRNTISADYPVIQHASLMFRPSSWGQPLSITHNNELYYEDGFIFADPGLLEMYDFKFIGQKPENALKEPNELIITTSIAKKYFGEKDAIGETLDLGGGVNLKIIGIIEDLPPNTHITFDILASFATYENFGNNANTVQNQWVWVAAWMYFMVDDPADVERIRNDLPDFVKRHYPQALQDDGVTLHIQKADNIHLTSHRELEFKANGKIQHVYIFSSIAFLILIIAIINFMNLSTSRSAKRGKEVGLRKAMGANKGMLVTQFMGEAILTNFIALLIALFIIYNILPWFNEVSGKSFSIRLIGNPELLLYLFAILIIVGLLSGSYPSLVMSSFNPVNVLKGKTILANSSQNAFRKMLVISQFVVSISLIISIGVVYKQLNFINTTNLGFDKEQILLVDATFRQINNYGSFKQALEENTKISGVTMMGGSIPGQEELVENPFVETGKSAEDQHWFSMFSASHDLDKVLNIEFIDGHSFQLGSSVDSSGYIINEAAARVLGWGEDVIGRSLDRQAGRTISGSVIGLVKDFHYRPLYDPIKPLVMFFSPFGSKIGIKMNTENLEETMAFVESQWNASYDGNPFRYSFMDKDYEKMYEKERKMSEVIQYFAILAIFIACLGLLGLSTFSTENRKKEIGIRKVNGASTFELLALLTRDFSKLILIAFVISIPISYYFGVLWLNDFAYRIKIGIDVYIIAGVAAMTVAIATISYHTIRAALRNPVESLRYE